MGTLKLRTAPYKVKIKLFKNIGFLYAKEHAISISMQKKDKTKGPLLLKISGWHGRIESSFLC